VIRKPPALVYFIQFGQDGPIKIGCSSNPWWRLREFQTGCPYRLSLIGCYAHPDAIREEHRLHRLFAGEHLHGEWFEYSERVETTIAMLLEQAQGAA
jgi:hypothetical protein